MNSTTSVYFLKQYIQLIVMKNGTLAQECDQNSWKIVTKEVLVKKYRETEQRTKYSGLSFRIDWNKSIYDRSQ